MQHKYSMLWSAEKLQCYINATVTKKNAINITAIIMQTRFALVINTLGIMQMRLEKRLHVLHLIILLEAARVKCLAYVFQPDLLDAWGRSSSSRAGAEEIAAQVNPPVQAPAQQAGEIQPAAGAQPVLQANEVRYYFCSGLNVTLVGLFASLVLLADICADNACEVCLHGVVFLLF